MQQKIEEVPLLENNGVVGFENLVVQYIADVSKISGLPQLLA
jgi:hypothetical protein